MTEFRLRRFLGWKALLVLALAGLACAGWWFWQQQQRHKADARIAFAIEQAVIESLANLGPENEIFRRYGRFRSLEGSGFARPSYAWQLIERLELHRRAVFENGSATVSIYVAETGPTAIRLQMTPAEAWVSQNPSAKIVKRDEQLWIVFDGGSSRSAIAIWASHPDFSVR